MKASQSPRPNDPGTLSTIVGIAFILAVPGIFVGLFIWNHYFQRPVADGPHEQALAAAIRSRDVAAARAAIAAGASLTAPLPLVEDTFENRRLGRARVSLGQLGDRPRNGWHDVHGPGRCGSRETRGNRPRDLCGRRRSERVSLSSAAGAAHYLIEDAVSYGDPELIQIMVDAGLEPERRGCRSGTGQRLSRRARCCGGCDGVDLDSSRCERELPEPEWRHAALGRRAHPGAWR